MDNSIFSYIQFIELIAFFSGYPLIYAVTILISDSFSKNRYIGKAGSLLPTVYALVGTLYLGLQLKNFYPDYSFSTLRQSIFHPWAMTWALASLLFWIPALARKKTLSLIHSLFFLYLLIHDLYIQFNYLQIDRHMIKNDMNIYTASLALNFCALLVVVFMSSILTRLLQKNAG
jgi:hypothetical protein